jgi:hypothetical protein
MHGPLYLTKGLVKALAKRNDDVVIREARPDGRIAIASGPDLDEDFGVSLLPRDPQAAKDQYRSQLLPEADDREFVLVPMDGDDLLVPAVNPAVA